MGFSRTYNFWVNVNLKNGKSYIEGVNSIKSGINLAEFYSCNHKSELINLELCPQTATGRRLTKKDYIIITPNLTVEHKSFDMNGII